jgi:hypothetical protein
MKSRIQCFLLLPHDHDGQSYVSANSPALWRAPNGAIYHLGIHEVGGVLPAPPGAMWFADWLLLSDRTVRSRPGHRTSDGHVLIVRVPSQVYLNGQNWNVDGPANNCPGWERTGTAPDVTARPSVIKYKQDGTCDYHGFLTDGWLEEV